MENEKKKLKRLLNWLIEKGLNCLPMAFFILAVSLMLGSIYNDTLLEYYNLIQSFMSDKIFTSARTEALSTIAVVLIGFNVTIMSVFGSSYSKAIVIISQNDGTKDFTSYSKSSLFSSFIFFICTIFSDTLAVDFFTFIYTSIFIWVITSFVRFTVIVLKMYDVNIKEAAQIAGEEAKEKGELINSLRELKEIMRVKETLANEDYFNNIKATAELQKKEATQKAAGAGNNK